MLNEREKEKALNRQLILTILDGPELQRGNATDKLQNICAAIPVSAAFAQKCGGTVAHIDFAKFAGNIQIDIPGGMDDLQTDLQEFRILNDLADHMDIETIDDTVEVSFVFWDLFDLL